MTEIKSYRNKDLLNRLSEMQQAHYYATACHTLVRAEQAIVNLENEIAELRAELAKVEQGAPVAWRGWDGDKWVFTLWREEMSVQLDWQPLFTKPQPVRTMSDEQIDEILGAAYTNAIATGKTNGGMVGETWNLIAARAIEAHIKGATE